MGVAALVSDSQTDLAATRVCDVAILGLRDSAGINVDSILGYRAGLQMPVVTRPGFVRTSTAARSKWHTEGILD